MNKKMIGAVLGTLAFGSMNIARAEDEAKPAAEKPAKAEAPLIFISDRTVSVPRPAVVYRPPSLVAGVGCSRGASSREILDLMRRSLGEAGLMQKQQAQRELPASEHSEAKGTLGFWHVLVQPVRRLIHAIADPAHGRSVTTRLEGETR